MLNKILILVFLNEFDKLLKSCETVYFLHQELKPELKFVLNLDVRHYKITLNFNFDIFNSSRFFFKKKKNNCCMCYEKRIVHVVHS